MGKRLRWGSVVLAVAVALSACGDDGGDGGSSTARAPSVAPESSGAPGIAGRVATDNSAASGAGAAPSAVLPRQAAGEVIYTGSIDVRVPEVNQASRDAQAKIGALGGYLFSQRSVTNNNAPAATLVFKVPPAKFVDALDQLGTLGTEVGRSVQADDVTAQIVDLESRLKTALASLSRTRDLLARATSISDIVTLEREVATRETTAEQLQGQLRVLQSQVAAATLTLTIGEQLKESKPSPSKDIPSVGDGLRRSGVALWDALRIVALVLVALLPWAILALVLWFLASRFWLVFGPRILRLRERGRARRATAFPRREPPANPVKPFVGASTRPAPPPPVGTEKESTDG
jgi:Domain of unknown function (DUF4349)